MLLCDPEHPALAEFPTCFHSDWQWWPIVRHGRCMVLDETPSDFRPLVQVIDNFERNHKLALAFEALQAAGTAVATSDRTLYGDTWLRKCLLRPLNHGKDCAGWFREAYPAALRVGEDGRSRRCSHASSGLSRPEPGALARHLLERTAVPPGDPYVVKGEVPVRPEYGRW